MRINIKKASTRNISLRGFTLIELMISISIIGLMASIATFGLNEARQSSRDAKRKTDLQNIRTAFELFYSDCGQYPPPTSDEVPDNINSGLSTINDPNSCPDVATGVYTYLSNVPTDPQGATRYYYTGTPNSYILCTHLEGADPSTPIPSGCGVCVNGDCNHKISGP